MAMVIIEDSATNLVILKRFAKSCYPGTLVPFTDPAAARDYLAANAADLVIMDCEMPGINGIELISEVRALERHHRTPILMVTQHQTAEIRATALAAGATDFLSKPVEALEFKLRVRKLLPMTAA